MRITTLLLGMLAAGCGLGAARAAAVPSDPDGDGLDKAQLEITAMDIALPVAFTALIGISNYAGWHFGRQYEKLQRERQNKINGNILETYEALPPDHRHLVDRRCKMIQQEYLDQGHDIVPRDVVLEIRAECTTELLKVQASYERRKREDAAANAQAPPESGDNHDANPDRLEMSIEGAKSLLDQTATSFRARFFDKKPANGAAPGSPLRGVNGRPMLIKGH